MSFIFINYSLPIFFILAEDFVVYVRKGDKESPLHLGLKASALSYVPEALLSPMII